MSKQVPMTPKIEAAIRAALRDPNADVSGLAVFEARFLSTEPLKKPGFFNKGRVTAGTLDDMVTYLNDAGALPLQIMHDTGVLPVGKVFSAMSRDMENGERELVGQFYVPHSKADIISDLETSLIDEVSVGMLNKQALCSECGFDYLGADATFDNFWELTCNEGHVLGENGTHVRLVGLEDWAELSLVNRGAAKNAKILPRVKQSMSDENFQRLAASGGAPLEARILVAKFKMDDTTTDNPNTGESEMDLKEIIAQLSQLTTENATVKVELAQAVKDKEAAEAQVAELTAAAATAAANDDKSNDDLKAELSAAQTDLTEATAKLAPHVKAALTADGVAETEIPTTLSAMVDMVEEKGLKLHQVIGSDKKPSVELSAEEAKAKLRKASFKIN